MNHPCPRWEIEYGSRFSVLSCQVRGIKFYDLSHVGAREGDGVFLEREPSNPHDPNCVGVFMRGGGGRRMLGHVARQAAEWLSPMLLGPFRITT